tara:strand:- start:223656 stop:224783 length:1128 start_codon:yes stop_codon:yes gene_type:complete
MIPKRIFLLSMLFVASSVKFGWAQQLQSRTPEELGVRSQPLVEMSRWVRGQNLDIRSMVLLRRGDIALEWYPADISRAHHHDVFSVTKSVVATLVGIAIKDGKLTGTDTDLQSLFPEAMLAETDPSKGAVTIGDLLTMRSGFPCARGNMPSGPKKELFDQIHRAPDRTKLILRLPMNENRERPFVYGNAEPQLVAAILERAYEQTVDKVANEGLFAPLDFKNHQWKFPDSTGTLPGGYGLRLRALDMAKLGQLYLQRGTWRAEQLLATHWVHRATADQTGTGYGYYWWTKLGDGSAYAARGVRGQLIYVDPVHEMVFVMTAELSQDKIRPTQNRLLGFLDNAITEHSSLPDNPNGFARLRDELNLAATYTPERVR